MRILFIVWLIVVFAISDIACLAFVIKISDLNELTFFKGALFFILLCAIWRGFEWLTLYMSAAVGVMDSPNKFKYYLGFYLSIINFLLSLSAIWISIPLNTVMVIVGIIASYASFRINWTIATAVTVVNS